LIHGLKTCLETLDLVSDDFSLGAKERLVEVNQLKEGSGSGVIVTSALCEELIVGLRNGQVDEGHMVGKSTGNILSWE
jgi:hypothetical protein